MKAKYQPLFVIYASQISVNDCIVGAEIKSSEISCDSSAMTKRKIRNVNKWKSVQVDERISFVRGPI